MGGGYVGILTVELHFPESHSLKEKRMVLRRVKDRTRQKFNVAVAEVEHQAVWQRAGLAIVSVSNEREDLDQTFSAGLHEIGLCTSTRWSPGTRQSLRN